jgi:ABC-type multidrug transport system fused ATPase/permease subunit
MGETAASGAACTNNNNTGVLFLYKHLWAYSQGRRGTLLAAMAMLLTAQCVLLSVPYFAGRAINTLQARVYDNLFATLKNACVVSSIHRLHLLERFDEVIVMHEGRVVAQGPAPLLAATSPDFRQLLATYKQDGQQQSPAANAA